MYASCMQDVVGHVMSHMSGEGGVRLMSGCEPRQVRRGGGVDEKKLLVTWYDSNQTASFQVSITIQAFILWIMVV